MKALYKVLILSALSVTGLSSCVNDWLDQSPSDGLDSETAIRSFSDVESVRTGVYAMLKGTSDFVDYYGRLMFVYGDMRGEDVQYNYVGGSSRANFYYYMNYSTADNFTNDGSSAVWATAYTVNDRANRLIEAAENRNISDADEHEAEMAQYAAEGRVIRAMTLFDLTRIYGKPYTEDGGASLGAVISHEPQNDLSSYKPSRSTVAECYDSIQADLDAAINSGALPEEKTQGYINLWAAKALQLRVYMTKGEWANALSVAEDIIANSPYTLWNTSEYAAAWDKNNSAHTNEMIFELLISDNSSSEWTDREGIAYLYSDPDNNGGYGDVIVTKAFSDMMESDPLDVRNDVLLKPAGSPSTYTSYGSDFTEHGVFINKMPPSAGDVRYANVPILRLSEVYLSGAEAAFQLGNTARAAELMNEIITRRTTDPTKTVTAADLTLDRIYTERRKELVGEGQRYFDVMRRGETVTRYTDANDRGWHDVLTDEARTFNRDSKKALPLIPSSEINANPNMQQNPLY